MPLRVSRKRSGAAFFFIVFLILFAALLSVAFGVLRYAAPEERLDWSSGPLPSLEEKALAMLDERSLTIRLTEAEIDALIKDRLRSQSKLSSYAEVTGARFDLSGDELVAHTIVRLANTADIAVTHRFRLEWSPPRLVVTHVSSRIKDVELPESWVSFEPVQISLELDDRLPIAVKDVEWNGDSVIIRLRLKMPDL
ncbi:hypothetical protein [Paenibacillus thermotolerans]|nr:hypothetical protein [Paenibacillus sp. YIM B05601]